MDDENRDAPMYEFLAEDGDMRCKCECGRQLYFNLFKQGLYEWIREAELAMTTLTSKLMHIAMAVFDSCVLEHVTRVCCNHAVKTCGLGRLCAAGLAFALQPQLAHEWKEAMRGVPPATLRWLNMTLFIHVSMRLSFCGGRVEELGAVGRALMVLCRTLHEHTPAAAFGTLRAGCESRSEEIAALVAILQYSLARHGVFDDCIGVGDDRPDNWVDVRHNRVLSYTLVGYHQYLRWRNAFYDDQWQVMPIESNTSSAALLRNLISLRCYDNLGDAKRPADSSCCRDCDRGGGRGCYNIYDIFCTQPKLFWCKQRAAMIWLAAHAMEGEMHLPRAPNGRLWEADDLYAAHESYPLHFRAIMLLHGHQRPRSVDEILASMVDLSQLRSSPYSYDMPSDAMAWLVKILWTMRAFRLLVDFHQGGTDYRLRFALTEDDGYGFVKNIEREPDRDAWSSVLVALPHIDLSMTRFVACSKCEHGCLRRDDTTACFMRALLIQVFGFERADGGSDRPYFDYNDFERFPLRPDCTFPTPPWRDSRERDRLEQFTQTVLPVSALFVPEGHRLACAAPARQLRWMDLAELAYALELAMLPEELVTGVISCLLLNLRLRHEGLVYPYLVYARTHV
jgi:hypothetical protein